MSRLPALVVSAVLPLLAACTSTSIRLDFTPSPAEVVVGEPGSSEAQTRVLVSVLGAERQGGARDAPFEMHLRMRIESFGETEVTLAPETLLLVDANLRPFEAGRIEGESPRVAPGTSASLDLYFPLPAGLLPRDLNLDGLNLRWTLQVGERPVLLGTSFSRVQVNYVYPYSYGPYWYPHSAFYYGRHVH